MEEAAQQWRDMADIEFRELADNAPVMIWRARPDKQCDWFNKPWRDFSGRTSEELFGYGWAEDVHADDFVRCVKTYEAAFDAREPFTMPYRLRRSDGVYRWFLDNGAPFYRDGVFAGYFGSCIDITEQRELEEHQRTLLAELNHRVKNNLQLILSFLQLSKMRAVTDEAKVLLGAAMRRIQGVGVIQDELYKSEGAEIDLGTYLTTLAKSIVNLENGEGGGFTAHADAILVPFELASNLGLIVNEVITNALKHAGHAGQRFSLSVERRATGAAIRISDQGPGFDLQSNNSAGLTQGARGSGIIEALAHRCNATVKRYNDGGAVVVVEVPLD